MTGLLAIVDDSVADDELLDAIRAGQDQIGVDTVTLVAPGPWSHAADLRLAGTVAMLAAHGIEAEAWVGDADPKLAVEDARTLVPVDVVLFA